MDARLREVLGRYNYTLPYIIIWKPRVFGTGRREDGTLKRHAFASGAYTHNSVGHAGRIAAEREC